MDPIDSFIHINYNEDSSFNLNLYSSNYYVLQFYGNYKAKMRLAVTGYILYNPQMKEIFSNSVCLTKYNSSYDASYYGLILGLEKAKEYDFINRVIIEGENIHIIQDLQKSNNISNNCRDHYIKVKQFEKGFESVVYRHYI
jgi:hypothetical protein